ncbi:hypothetical protein O1611_g10575 [Lasiodiplodia mahajangana]|uniref:Uncharacterized protein n=1 Tax=Lasiodiplodia mahajangana TaxID=1108764 RepID=A0ACC2IWL8_9PEZI|nr:hypothetical protein O1611_g10575 [Lasiodiplodia mahajangana]
MSNPDSSSEDYNYESEPSIGPLVLDIANTHDDNYTLIKRRDVQNFYEKLADSSQPPAAVVEWLASIPDEMRNTAIPLFRECMTGADDEVHYQVHPCHSQLPRRAPLVQRPHFYISKMILSREQPGHFVVPFGRLFVNMPIHNPHQPHRTSRVSKWTGYELLFDTKLDLWIVFNEGSLDGSWSGWFPAKCNLGYRPAAKGDLGAAVDPLDEDMPAATLEEMVTSPSFKWAHVELQKPVTLQELTFHEMQEQIKNTMTSDETKIWLEEAEEYVVSLEFKR